MGGHLDDDSLHMGSNSHAVVSADNMSGYHSSDWVWRSITIDGPPEPWLPIVPGYNNIDMYARENSMRVDRILLTYNFAYNPDSGNPSTDIRCGAEGLPQ
jgi:hypothetical protein